MTVPTNVLAVPVIYKMLERVYNAGKDGKPMTEAINEAFDKANKEDGLKWVR